MYYVGQPSNQARRLVETTYEALLAGIRAVRPGATLGDIGHAIQTDRKSTRLNSSHLVISYAVFCLKKKKTTERAGAVGSRGTAVIEHAHLPTSIALSCSLS